MLPYSGSRDRHVRAPTPTGRASRHEEKSSRPEGSSLPYLSAQEQQQDGPSPPVPPAECPSVSTDSWAVATRDAVVGISGVPAESVGRPGRECRIWKLMIWAAQETGNFLLVEAKANVKATNRYWRDATYSTLRHGERVAHFAGHLSPRDVDGGQPLRSEVIRRV
jgi:hypothetical protein